MSRAANLPSAARNLDPPLSRFPLRGPAGGPAASATLRLGHGAGPKPNAHPRSGPVRKKCSLLGGYAAPKPPLAVTGGPVSTLCCKPDRSSVNKTGHLDELTAVQKTGDGFQCPMPRQQLSLLPRIVTLEISKAYRRYKNCTPSVRPAKNHFPRASGLPAGRSSRVITVSLVASLRTVGTVSIVSRICV